MKSFTKNIAAENTFTDAIQLDAGQRAAISISGTFSATVFVQRRMDGTNWRDIQSFTANTEQSYISDAGEEIRVGVKTGGYSSGTAAVLVAIK